MPLLAFAASRLWEKRDRDGGLITRAAYRQIGGVAGSLAQHAEATLDGIGAERVPIVRELVRNLVTAQGTRALRERVELLSVFGGSDRSEAESVLGALLDARLLTSYERVGEGGESQHQVEIIHESLLEAWPRLVRWRTQDADGAQLRDQLRQAAQLWEEKGRSPDLLWTGSAYQEFRLWLERYPGSLSEVEADYARKMADRAQRRKRLLRLAIASAFAVITAVAIAIGLSRQQALRALDRAEASRLLAIGELRLRDDPTEALAFATASLARSDSEEARVFAIRTLWEAPPAIEAVASGQSSRNLEFSPDGGWLAAGGFAADAHVWSSDGQDPLVLPGHDPNPRGGIVPRWASNDLLVTGSMENAASQVHLWSVPEGRRLRTVDFGSPSYWSVGSRRLLVETRDAPDSSRGPLLRQWAIPDGEPVVLGRGVPTPGATWTFFAPDGRSWFYLLDRDVYARPLPVGAGRARLVTRLGTDLEFGLVWNDPDRFVVADKSGRIQTWSLDAERPAPERSLQKPDTATLVIPEPSGRWLRGPPAADQLLRVWDLAAWRAAQPLSLRRNLSWYVARAAFHPSGDWVVASTAQSTRLTFWPLKRSYPAIVDGYFTGINRPVAFSPDSRWLVTNWADRRLRLWPVTDRGLAEPRTLDPSVPPSNWRSTAFDPKGRHVFAVGGMGRAWVFPLDGSPARRLDGPVGDSGLNSAAVSPSGRRVATAFYYGKGPARLYAWDLETGERRQFDLPESERAASTASPVRTGYEQGVFHLAFADENTLFTAGDGGLRRWDLETGSHEIVATSTPGYALLASFNADARVAVTAEVRMGRFDDCRRALLHDLANRSSQPLTQFGTCASFNEVGQLDASGTVAATGGRDGIARVGRLSGAEPHLLLGHKGVVDRVAVSPDLRWVATAGEDNTLRLWPIPDLSKPPLHTLPHEELLGKLRSLTNLRVVADPNASEGWRLEVGPFPGWKSIPEW